MLEYRLTFLFFTMGLVAFHVSALLFAWLEFSWPVRRRHRRRLSASVTAPGVNTRSRGP